MMEDEEQQHPPALLQGIEGFELPLPALPPVAQHVPLPALAPHAALPHQPFLFLQPPQPLPPPPNPAQGNDPDENKPAGRRLDPEGEDPHGVRRQLEQLVQEQGIDLEQLPFEVEADDIVREEEGDYAQPATLTRRQAQEAVVEKHAAKLVAGYKSYIQRRTAILDQRDLNQTDSTTFLSLINNALQLVNSPPLLQDDPGAKVREKTFDFTFARFENPLVCNLATWTSNGTLEEVDIKFGESENNNGLAEFYERFVEFDTPQDLRDALASYTKAFPADSAFEKLVLVELGFQEGKGSIMPTTKCAIPYNGIAVHGNPVSRARDVGRHVRLKNFLSSCKTSGHTYSYRSFNVKPLQLECDNPDEVRYSPKLGIVETIGILASFHTSLNTTLNAARHRLLPPLFESKIVKEAGATLSQLEEILPRSDINHADFVVLLERLEKLLQDEHQLFSSLGKSKTGLMVDRNTAEGREAYESILGDLQALCPRGDRHERLSMLVTKDIPLRAIQGSDHFSGPKAGIAPYLRWSFTAAVLALDEEKDAALGVKQIQSRGDIWALCAKHEELIIAIAFLSRKTTSINPYFIELQSSKVSNIFSRGLLKSVFQSAEQSAASLAAFFNLTTPTTRESLLAILTIMRIVWKETPTKEWIEQVGDVFVTLTGPGELDICVAMSTLDPGYGAHDPTLLPYILKVHLITAAKVAVTRKVVATRLSVGDRPPTNAEGCREWNQKLRADIQEESENWGIEPELKKRRTELATLSQAVCGLRARSAFERANQTLRQSGIPQNEIDAKRSAFASEVRDATPPGPTFSGPPLVMTAERKLLVVIEEAFSRSAPSNILNPSFLPSDHPDPRINQLRELLLEHRETVLDGRKSSLPSIEGWVIADRQWIMWFVTSREGIQMRISAGQKNKLHVQPSRSEEEAAARKDRYVSLALKREAARREKDGKKNIGELTMKEALKLVGGETPRAQGKGSRRNVVVVFCEACRETLVVDIEKGQHFCYASGSREVKKMEEHTDLIRQRPLYAAALFTLLDMSHQEQLDLADKHGLKVFESFKSLSLPLRLSLETLSNSASIFFATPRISPAVKNGMALDALLHCTGGEGVLRAHGNDRPWNKGGNGAFTPVVDRMVEQSKVAVLRGVCGVCGLAQYSKDQKSKQHP
ncbi:hypothetical protein P7C70_g8402, partial [Phenoliferia sp. Uapishka_3]